MAANFLYFDRQDHELLFMVNKILEQEPGMALMKPLFDPSLHPNGIKQMSISRELRVAYAVVNLLTSLEDGQLSDRLRALQSLRDEVLYTGADSFRRNTGRVLIQIMKDLVRAYGHTRRQLMLAHDFMRASTGNPRIIRGMLRRYHLLEMPEDWSQLSFDDHVHDAHTKGRKTSTHLIMDAWIKGIRSLTVIYYNYVEEAAARELLQAAAIMGMDVRIGVEFNAGFRDKMVQFIWVPTGFAGVDAFIEFLQSAAVAKLMREGQTVSCYRENIVRDLLENFNRVHRERINAYFKVDLPVLNREEFEVFVGPGQASRLHLAEFIHRELAGVFDGRLNELRDEFAAADAAGCKAINGLVDEMNMLDPETILERWLVPSANPGINDPDSPVLDEDSPALLKHSVHTLVDLVAGLRANYECILTLSGLTVEDILEILYDCEGRVTHLEMFNLKEYTRGCSPYLKEVCALRQAVNEGSVIALKRIIRASLGAMRAAPEADEARCAKFTRILKDIPRLQSFYATSPLQASLGSDSTGRSHRLLGMGLVYWESLPLRARREAEDPAARHTVIPIHTTVCPRLDFFPRKNFRALAASDAAPQRRTLLPADFRFFRKRSWVAQHDAVFDLEAGNVIALGGIDKSPLDNFSLDPAQHISAPPPLNMTYLNTRVRNGLKVMAGFVPAMLTFLYTQDWWFLAWFGAVIWFFITFSRNIVQAVLAGRGIRRTSLLRWNDYINWNRVMDSLMYTGLSVPLLDLLIRTALLQEGLGLTVSNAPLLVFTVISAANGVYLAAHNVYRGLPIQAAMGNLFRSALAIPTAMVFNFLLIHILEVMGLHDYMLYAQQSAAIVSKLSSDCVAALIEGLADRARNVRIRSYDYRLKLNQLFSTFAKMELIFPEQDVLEVLKQPKELIRTMTAEARGLERTIIINALDLMYFWMYQPRAATVLKDFIRRMTPEERTIFARSQNVLVREREISQMFVDGMVGRNFAPALAFFLGRYYEYLEEMYKLTGEKDKPEDPAHVRNEFAEE